MKSEHKELYLMEQQRTPVDQQTRQPRIVRVVHCDQCGCELDALETPYGRCTHCRSLPPSPPEGRVRCPACSGYGVRYFWAGAPESDDCMLCWRAGHVTPEVAAEWVAWHRGAGVAS